MQKKRRWWRIVLGVVVALLLGLGTTGYLMAPGWVKSYIEERYPGVTVGQVELHWLKQEVTLYNVTVDRPGLKATLPVVHGDRDKNVKVVGGTVEVTIDEEAPEKTGGGTSGVTLNAEGLDVTVHYKGATAELKGTKVNQEEVCFEEGTVVHPKVKATVHSGCAKRDKSLIRVGMVEVPLTLPPGIPKIEREQTITIQELRIEPGTKRVQFDRALMTPIAAIQGPATVEVAGDKVFFKSPMVEVDHAWLAPYPVSFKTVEVVLPLGALKGEKGLIEVHLGRAIVLADLVNKGVGGSEPCAEWFDAFPQPLPDAMKGMTDHYKGDLTFEVRAEPTPKVEVKSTCKYDCKAEPIRSILNQTKFKYMAYDAENKLVEREAGPGVQGWTFLGNLPPHIPRAFVLLEDPDFPAHKGVLPKALENSLKINLEKGEFAKGGSTITMQTAKNLWLRRHKSIGRKAEEALLTYALESCFSKERILELYLNIIEFGPNLYGIGPAARHYFRKDPSHLTAEEAFYLASILPAPRKALAPNAGGLARAKRIMKGLAHSGFISEYMIEDESAPANASGWEAND